MIFVTDVAPKLRIELMDKTLLHQQIIGLLAQAYQTAQAATQMAIDSATDQQNVPEHKYDTLSLEAAYLAHGQAQRMQQCEADWLTFKQLPVRHFIAQQALAVGALVELENSESPYLRRWFFISPVAGGVNLQYASLDIQLVTPNSPLGQQLLKHQLDDEFELRIGEQLYCYCIVSVA